MISRGEMALIILQIGQQSQLIGSKILFSTCDRNLIKYLDLSIDS